MDWTEPRPPTEGVSHYNHVACDTPLGICLIEWKSWKAHPDYDVSINYDCVGFASDLDEAKRLAIEWLTERHKELSDWLGLPS